MTNPRKFSFLGSLFVTLVLILAVGSITPGVANAAASELFISEYIEGSSFNKAIEIYNGTGNAVDLVAGAYSLELYSNGAATPSQSVALSGAIADGDVFVLAHGSADMAILAQADATNNSVINFNGDDAVVLRKNGAVVDAFGQIGVDPGSEWAGGGQDDTLRRKADVCAGDTDATDAFDASVEWDSFAQNTFDGLGGHTADCDGSAAPQLTLNEIVISTTGTDREFIEIAGSPGDSLDGIFFLEVASGGEIDTVLDLSGSTIPADGFWVATSPEAEAVLGVTGDFSIANNTLTNNPQTYILVQAFTGTSGDDIDTADDGTIDNAPWSALLDTIAVVDASNPIVYGSNIVGPDGSFLAPGGYRCPDADGAWLMHAFSDTAAYTAGTANSCGGAELVINEIMQNPAAVLDSSGEWFEIYNAGSSDVDVNGWTIADNGSDNHVINNGGPLVIPADGYLVLGVNADSASNGGVPVDYSYGSGWFLGNSDDEVVLIDSDGNEVDRVEYDGGPAFPDPNGATMALSSPELDNNDGANWCTSSTPFGDGDLGTPGAANDCDGGGGEPVEAKIHDVQGNGGSVAITSPVIVEAIVIGDYQGNDQLSGFFIQEEDGDVDMDADTSEGIFVYCGGCATDVSVGDLVQVTGLPEEFFGMSQIDVTEPGGEISFVSNGNALPMPATIDLPASGSSEAETTFESVEGMLATFSDELFVSEYFELARYGQLVLTADARPRQFTDEFEPSVPGYAAFLDDLNSRRIILDDDNNIQNDAIEVGPDEPYFWPRPGLSISNFVRGGDSISGLTGVLHWSFAGQSGTDAWRVRPVEEAFSYEFSSNNARPAEPDDVAGSLKVASFNVLNYFTTLDSRGADSLAELDRQREKIAAAVCGMDADIVGLIEIENNGSVALLDLLNGANGINVNCGPYAYIDTGVIGTDEIAVAFIYRAATATPVGDFAVLDSSVDPRFLDDFNRPALAQTFEETATGGALTVVVNHLKSKGSACTDVGDPDISDGQGNCNVTRTMAAEAMVDWLATDPTGSGDSDFLIMGDLNSYRNEDPIDAIEDGADDTAGTADDYVDLLDTFIGSSAYTYVFDGQLGYLDHALANNNLFSQVTGVTAWHINADEIPVFDYNDDIDDGSSEASFERKSSALPIYEPNAFRASDHDPVIVGLDLNGPPNCEGAEPRFSTLWPPNHKMRVMYIQGVTDPDGDPVSITIDGIFQDEAVDAPGSGNTAPDGKFLGPLFGVRAERVGSGNGRVYHITFTASDGMGGSCSGEVLVGVPRSRHMMAIDDGPLFDSTEAPPRRKR